MKVVCRTCGRRVATRRSTPNEDLMPDERVVVKHRLGRSPRHLKTVRGTRSGKGFSEHRPVNRQGKYVPQPVCGGSGNLVRV